MLLDFSLQGCEVATGEDWTREVIETAVAQGARPSTMDPEAIQQLHDESKEKANQGFVRMVNWLE